MPTISMFYGITISMYYDEHNPPHFHARFQDYQAAYDLEGNLLRGKMPPQQQKLIAAWAVLHKDELMANWQLASERESLYKIDPLK